jgi:hypothetical protein
MLPLRVLPLRVLPLRVLPLRVLPLRVLPLRVPPLRVLPMRVLPLRALLLRVLPLRALLLRASPVQVPPLQVLPLRVLPVQVPPALPLRASSRQAIAVSTSGLRMRWLPTRLRQARRPEPHEVSPTPTWYWEREAPSCSEAVRLSTLPTGVPASTGLPAVWPSPRVSLSLPRPSLAAGSARRLEILRR